MFRIFSLVVVTLFGLSVDLSMVCSCETCASVALTLLQC